MVAIKCEKFSQEQKDQWVQRSGKTHEAQQYLIFGLLHGIYSDPASNEEARVNSLSVATEFAPHFTPRARSDLINWQHDYIAKGDEKRCDLLPAIRTSYFSKESIILGEWWA